jgi:cysteine desulfurase / selenocysteine lyase
MAEFTTFTREEIENIRADFPILKRVVNGEQIVYLDNAATTQKPAAVIDSMADFLKTSNANIHRAIHTLGYESTVAFENAHKVVAKFIGAKSWREIVFVRNATEALNLVAYSWASKFLSPGDEVVVTMMEHHSNIVPWMMAKERLGINLKFIKVKPGGALDLKHAAEMITGKTKLVGAIHASNVLGIVNDLKFLGDLARSAGARFLVDGAQSVPHIPVNVSDIGCDFLAASAHKMLGPTGIGILYAKREILEEMPPFLTGGDMISTVTFEGATWNELPFKFEAGTPAVAEAIGFSEAVKYLTAVGMEKIHAYEKELEAYFLSELKELPFIELYGHREGEHLAVFSFNIRGIHPHDVANMLDRYGIAVRSGNHCAQPLMDYLKMDNTLRASFYFYNTKEEADKLISALKEINSLFNKNNIGGKSR